MTLAPAAYLTSSFLSLLGNAIAAIALPLIVLQTTGSALGAGVVAAATAMPAVLAGVFMGVVIDRIDRRTASVLTDLVSAASVAALPVVDLVTGLSLGWFVLLGVVGSLGDVPGMTAREALLPAVVRHGGISAERLVGLREGLAAFALVVGPAVAGTLMTVFDGATVLWITAATSLAAALTTLLLPRDVGAAVAEPQEVVGPRSATADLREGLRTLARSPFLVAVTAVSTVSVLMLAAFQGLVLPVHFTLAGRPGLLGFVLTALAVGMLGGSAAYAVAGTGVSRARILLLGLLGTTLGFAVMATLAAPWVVFAGAFVVGASSGLLNGSLTVLLMERIPDAARGRVLGTQNAAATAAAPVGLVLAAVVTEYGGVQAAAVTLAALWAVTALVAVRSRALRTLEPTVDRDEVTWDA
ncbi:MFS transporter [Mumia sp. DW29H23]|uniref:MFS transporter n=1 Tax=Mumia sp. DW29H23 TaxID=3421241 RepID=UPI003D69C6AF